MCHIAKHDSEEEGKGGEVQHGRIDLFVMWSAISAQNFIRRCCDAVELKKSGKVISGKRYELGRGHLVID
jgi:hypothetical protein